MDDIEGLVEYAATVKGARLVILFKEMTAGEIGLSIRSRGYVNVDKFAGKFGGGGHKGAGGCVIKGDIESVKRKVLKAALSYVR